MTATKAEIAQSREAGESARRAGRDLKTCPTYGIGAAWQDRRDAWRDGWIKAGLKIVAERTK